jgi:hypothetical protein
MHWACRCFLRLLLVLSVDRGARMTLAPLPSSFGALSLAGGSSPRPTHFLCWCKESKQRKHLQHACGGRRSQRSLRSAGWRAGSRAAGARQGGRCEKGDSLLQRALAARPIDGAPTPGRVPHSQLGRTWTRSSLISRPVERLLRETQHTTTWSEAISGYGDHCMRVEGAFFAYFLCTSKESEPAAGTDPPPTIERQPANAATRNRPRQAPWNS